MTALCGFTQVKNRLLVFRKASVLFTYSAKYFTTCNFNSLSYAMNDKGSMYLFAFVCFITYITSLLVCKLFFVMDLYIWYLNTMNSLCMLPASGQNH